MAQKTPLRLGILSAFALLPALAQGGFPYPPQMQGAVEMEYKAAGGVHLNLYVFNPPGFHANDKRPAIVFFFGGGWTSGSPKQFEQQCRHLASRGMVAISADYRVSSRHRVKAVDCVRDAKSAIRWVRQNASRLGVDPHRIAAGGGSAGGHLAAAAALIPGLDETTGDTQISSRPDALVLFNPAAVLAPVPGLPNGRSPADMEKRMGLPLEQISPYHHIAKGAPPTVIFHGQADTTVPYSTVEAFAKRMAEFGNRCDLHGFEGENHGFFNYGRGGNKAFQDTLAKTDAFLVSLGYLKPAR